MLLLYQKALSSLIGDTGKEFLIDPIIYRLRYQNIMQVTSEKSWFERFLSIVDPEIRLIGDDGTLNLESLLDIENVNYLANNVFNFEKTSVDRIRENVHQVHSLLKYLGDYAITEPQIPTPNLKFFIPPYLIIEDNKTLEINMEILRKSIEIIDVDELLAPITFSRDYFVDVDLSEFTSSFSNLSLKNFMVWVTAFNEYEEPEELLTKYIEMLKILKQELSADTVVNAYSSYFSDLLAGLGYVDVLVHGVGIVESRDPLTMLGVAMDRYYVPAMHQFLSLDKAENLRQVNPDLFGCNCGICDESKPIQNMPRTELLRHFIRVKRFELDEIRSHKNNRSQLLAILDEAVQNLMNAGKVTEIREIVLSRQRVLEKWKSVLEEI